jgi:hypothetical protein
MFCSHCGKEVISPEARFCPNCGIEIYKASKDEHQHPEKQSASTNQKSTQKSAPTKPLRISGIIFILLFVVSLGIYLAAIIPAFAGNRPSSQGVATGFITWNVILFYILFRWKNKKGWVGGIAGFVFGFGVLVAAEVVAINKQNNPSYTLSHSPER